MTSAATFFVAKFRRDTSGDFQTARNFGAAVSHVVAANRKMATNNRRMRTPSFARMENLRQLFRVEDPR
jgi:hypothetical protein